MKKFGLFIGLMLMAMLACASQVRAHVEAVEMAADVVYDRDKLSLELRIPVRELINAEQPIDAVVMPNFDQDPMEVAKRHEQEMLAGFRISYDGKVLTPRLISTQIQSLVIGVSEEDTVPRPCALYTMEFSAASIQSAPSRVDLTMSLFTLPPEAGYQPTVMCLVTHNQLGSQTTKTAVISHEDMLTIKPQWSADGSKRPAAAPGGTVALANAPAARSRGPMIVLALGAVVAVALLVVLARRRT